MEKNELFKNFPYQLTVWEGKKEILIGSEVEPICVGHTEKPDEVGIYHFIGRHLIKQRGRWYLIESTTYASGYDDYQEWLAYRLPETLDIDRAEGTGE